MPDLKRQKCERQVWRRDSDASERHESSTEIDQIDGNTKQQFDQEKNSRRIDQCNFLVFSQLITAWKILYIYMKLFLNWTVCTYLFILGYVNSINR
jgi:hypothetical protein